MAGQPVEVTARESQRRRRWRVLLVDGEEMFAQSLRFALEAQGDLEVVETADSLRRARAVMATASPDVVVLESRLPDGAAIAAVPDLRRASPASKVVLLTSGPDAAVAAEAVGAGCSGLVSRTGTLDELVAAVRGAAAGQVYVSPGVLAKLLPRLQRVTQRPGWDFTAREKEVLRAARRRAVERRDRRAPGRERPHRPQSRAEPVEQAGGPLEAGGIGHRAREGLLRGTGGPRDRDRYRTSGCPARVG